MSKYIALLTLLCSVTTFAHHEWPEVIAQPIEGVHIPIGFDDNDQITVALTGTLKKTCHLETTPKIKINTNAETIVIKNIVHGYPSTCAETAIPYSRVVEIGLLPAGVYTLIDGTTDRTLGTLPVRKASKAGVYGPYADEEMYALVQDAYIHPHGVGSDPTLTLEVKVPEGCMRFREARVEYFPGVIVVMPILEGEATCKGELRSERHEIALTERVYGRQLLHVRSLWGRSLNKIVELDGNGE